MFFGENIWDIQLKGFFGTRFLYVYTIRKRPYLLKLKFLHHEEAKYIHDLFHYGEATK